MTADFWTWSLSTYRHRDVQETTIKLQDDFDLNVNIILWCCWCASAYQELPEFALRKAIEETSKWTNSITAPIRGARRASKEQVKDNRALYEALKNVELMAEEVEQKALEEIAIDHLAPSGHETPMSMARRNLSRYVSFAGAARRPGFSVELIERLLIAIFGEQSTDENAVAGLAGNEDV